MTLEEMQAETDRHRAISLMCFNMQPTVGAEVEVHGERDDRLPPLICTVVRLDETSAWVWVPGHVRPRLMFKMTGVKL